MITNRGIYNDLNESLYSFKAYGLIFYFSSELYRTKYKMGLLDFVYKESRKLRAYYRINSNFDSYLAIAFYKRIEKRGFRVIIDGDVRKELKEGEIKFFASIL